MKKQLALSLAAVMCAAGATVFAGDDESAEKPEMYSIYKETVRPALTEQYEAALKRMISEFEQYQIDPEKVNFKTISGPEIGYIFVIGWAF